MAAVVVPVSPRVVVLVVGGERGAAGSGHRAAGAHQRQHQAGPGERGEGGGEAAGGSAVRAAVSAGSRYEHGRLPLRRLRGELSGSGREVARPRVAASPRAVSVPRRPGRTGDGGLPGSPAPARCGARMPAGRWTGLGVPAAVYACANAPHARRAESPISSECRIGHINGQGGGFPDVDRLPDQRVFAGVCPGLPGRLPTDCRPIAGRLRGGVRRAPRGRGARARPASGRPAGRRRWSPARAASGRRPGSAPGSPRHG